MGTSIVRRGRQQTYDEPGRAAAYETAYEAFYRYHVRSGLTIQSDSQVVSHPFFDGNLVNSTSFIVRAELLL